VLCDCRPSLLCADALVGACPAVGLSVRVSVVVRLGRVALRTDSVLPFGKKKLGSSRVEAGGGAGVELLSSVATTRYPLCHALGGAKRETPWRYDITG
jgi:hypothetical protein